LSDGDRVRGGTVPQQVHVGEVVEDAALQRVERRGAAAVEADDCRRSLRPVDAVPFRDQAAQRGPKPNLQPRGGREAISRSRRESGVTFAYERACSNQVQRGGNAVQKFLSRFAPLVSGVLSGFDRLIFRGFLRRLCYPEGLEGFLAYRDICRKDFGERAEQWTELTKELSLKPALEQNVHFENLTSSAIDKGAIAQRVLQEKNNAIGPLCVLTAVEPCTIWNAHRSKKLQRIVFDRRQGRCQHIYHYINHEDLGLIHVRLQTWMPYEIQVYVNGREWLARQMQREGMRFTKDDNCFPLIEDLEGAQKLMDGFLKVRWQQLLDGLAQQINPALEQILNGFKIPYYWVAHQTEWATDVMFKDPEDLTHLMPSIVRHCMETLHSNDVFQFLGKKLNGNFEGEVLTKYRRRAEGECIRFTVEKNSLKLYQKLLWILRIEATINFAKFFPVMRTADGQGQASKKLRPMRKSICDLGLRANVSQASNKRLLDNLAVIADPTRVKDLVDGITKPTELAGRRVRGIQPWSTPDLELLSTVSSGDFLLHGFRNRDVASRLYNEPAKDDAERKRRSARVSRLLRLLRAHGLIEKVARTHRYLLTKHGAAVLAAVLGVRDLPLSVIKRAA
jgi:hypothetical protein